MADKLCPTCKEINPCTVIEEGILDYTYRCSKCNTVFERQTYFKAIGSTVAGVTGLIFAAKKLYDETQKNNKKFF